MHSSEPLPSPNPDLVSNLVDFAAFLDSLATSWDLHQNAIYRTGHAAQPADRIRWRTMYISDFLRAWSDTLRHDALYHRETADIHTLQLSWKELAHQLLAASTDGRELDPK